MRKNVSIIVLIVIAVAVGALSFQLYRENEQLRQEQTGIQDLTPMTRVLLTGPNPGDYDVAAWESLRRDSLKNMSKAEKGKFFPGSVITTYHRRFDTQSVPVLLLSTPGRIPDYAIGQVGSFTYENSGPRLAWDLLLIPGVAQVDLDPYQIRIKGVSGFKSEEFEWEVIEVIEKHLKPGPLSFSAFAGAQAIFDKECVEARRRGENRIKRHHRPCDELMSPRRMLSEVIHDMRKVSGAREQIHPEVPDTSMLSQYLGEMPLR